MCGPVFPLPQGGHLEFLRLSLCAAQAEKTMKKAVKSLKLNGFLRLVPGAGIEPAHLSVGDFESQDKPLLDPDFRRFWAQRTFANLSPPDAFRAYGLGRLT